MARHKSMFSTPTIQQPPPVGRGCCDRVAEAGFEPTSRGYEPREVPLLHSAR